MIMTPCLLLCFFLLAATATGTSFLGISGSGFTFDSNPVFLSGANQAWINYGSDFGNNQTNGAACALQDYLRNVSSAGGNSIRIWIFIEGQSIPAFDNQGRVTATDAAGSLVEDVRKYLRAAASLNIFAHLCLWNGALMRDPAMKGLITDTAKLQTFVDNALTPMVQALKGEPGLGSWEIINEPEGSVDIASDSEPCFDTQTVLSGSGAGWSGAKMRMQDLQRFVNVQTAAIHAADPKALVTVGSWSEYASTDAAGLDPGRKFFNYWKPECLVKAGGQKSGVLDYYQIHTYANNGKFNPGSPMTVKDASKYGLGKPVVIGEFSAAKCRSSGCTIGGLYEHALSGGYGGAWDWALLGGDGNDDEASADAGMAAVRGDKRTQVDVKAQLPAPFPNTCTCSDVAPDSTYTCAQQASWGKCGSPFMKGKCCRSCHACKGCS